MSIADLTGGPSRPYSERPTTNRGRVLPTPPGEDWRVQITDVGGGHYFEIPPEQWTSVPTVGQECLVVFDDAGDAWGVVPASGQLAVDERLTAVEGSVSSVESSVSRVESAVGHVPSGMSETNAAVNAPAIQAEVDAIAATVSKVGKVTLPPGGSFELSAGIVVPAGTTVEWDGNGSELVQGGDFPIIDVGTTPRSASTLPLTADVLPGAVTLTMSPANALTLVAGQYLDVLSNLQFGANALMREIVRIQSVNAVTGVITLYSPVEDYYLLVDSARVYTMAFRGYGVVADLTLRNKAPNTRPATTNEVQKITLTGSPTGGVWTLTFPANGFGISTGTSAGIPPLPTEDDVTFALDPILGVDNYDLAITAYDTRITYLGTLEARNIPTPTVNTAALTGGTPGATVTTITTGGPGPVIVNALRFNGLKEMHVEDCNFFGIDQVGVDVWDCLRGEVCSNHYEDFSDLLTLSRSGYANRAVGSTRDLKIHHNTSRKGRHFFTTSGAVRHCAIFDNTFTEHTNVPCDQHAGAKHMRYSRNTHDRCVGGAYQVRSADVIIEDYTIAGDGGSGPQIYIWAKDAGITYPDYVHNTKVMRGTVHGCAGNVVKLVNVDGCEIDGIRVRKHRAGASSVIFGGVTQPNRCTVRNVDIEGTPGDTGYGVYFDSGDGHEFDNIKASNLSYAVRVAPSMTNFSLGRVRQGPLGGLTGLVTGVAASYRDTVRPADVDEYRDRRRSSDCSTFSRLDGTIAIAPATGVVLATQARNMVARTYTKVRFALGTTFTAVTELRVGVWDIAGVLLGSTGNLIGLAGITTPAANTLMDNIPLLAGVPLIYDQDVYLGVAAVGTTCNYIGKTMTVNLSALAGIAGTRDTRTTGGYTGGTLPTLATSTSALMPWIELIP